MLGRYFAASAFAFAIDYGTYWLVLVLHPGLSRPASASAAYLIGAVVHYFISRRFVFAPGWLHARHWREFALFLATGLAGAAVTALVVALVGLVPGSGIHWPQDRRRRRQFLRRLPGAEVLGVPQSRDGRQCLIWISARSRLRAQPGSESQTLPHDVGSLLICLASAGS